MVRGLLACAGRIPFDPRSLRHFGAPIGGSIADERSFDAHPFADPDRPFVFGLCGP